MEYSDEDFTEIAVAIGASPDDSDLLKVIAGDFYKKYSDTFVAMSDDDKVRLAMALMAYLLGTMELVACNPLAANLLNPHLKMLDKSTIGFAEFEQLMSIMMNSNDELCAIVNTTGNS